MTDKNLELLILAAAAKTLISVSLPWEREMKLEKTVWMRGWSAGQEVGILCSVLFPADCWVAM